MKSTYSEEWNVQRALNVDNGERNAANFVTVVEFSSAFRFDWTSGYDSLSRS